MPKGKYTVADIEQPNAAATSAQPIGQYTVDDIDTSGSPAPPSTPGFLSRAGQAAGKAWDVANTPLVPEPSFEKTAHEFATSAPSEFDVNHPIIGGALKGITGAGADTMRTVRGFTSPASLATLGLGAAAKASGAVGMISRALSLGAGAGYGAQGAYTAGSAAADERPTLSPDKVSEMLFGGAQAAGGATGVGDAVHGSAPSLAPRLVNSILKPGLKEFDFGRNPGQSVVDAGIVANSKAGLFDKIRDARQNVGREIGNTLNSPPSLAKSIDASGAVQPVNDAMMHAARTGEQGLASRLFDVRQGLTKDMDFAAYDPATRQPATSNLVTLGDKNLSAMSPLDVFNLKKDVGDATKWHGAPFDTDVNQARAGVYGKLKDYINTAVPEVAPLNDQYGGLLGAEKSLDKTLRVGERQSHLSMADIASGGLGGVIGLAGSTPEAFGTAATGMLLRRLFESTPVKTRTAQLFAQPSPIPALSPAKMVAPGLFSAQRR